MAKKTAKKSSRNANYNTARKGAAKRAKREATQRSKKQQHEDYDNELRGVLFKNNRKQHDAQPDRSGSCTIDGVEYWISGWVRRPKSGGEPFLSLAFTAKDAPEPDYDNDGDDDDTDDLPF